MSVSYSILLYFDIIILFDIKANPFCIKYLKYIVKSLYSIYIVWQSKLGNSITRIMFPRFSIILVMNKSHDQSCKIAK